jgi:hypothetical protein
LVVKDGFVVFQRALNEIIYFRKFNRIGDVKVYVIDN